MGLTAGSKLGPYEIGAPLGAGGMGEVYRARDTRLDRSVAIKILPQHLSADAAAKQRFDREARAVSSLSHANICQLYDVGSQDGTDFLVMEFLEGETLADRLTKGPLPLEQVLRHGAEICDGLEKAHRSGVVHRDLKPGNIMLTKSGAKLMDFGLAKASMPENQPSSGLTKTFSSPVLSQPLTAQGTLIGTFQYMSPEQVEGKEADTRSDIFSLGAVLYEMVTGKRAFEGKSQISVASAILERDPEPITTVQPMAPAALDHVVRGCLAKDPEGRWQSAADIARQLRWIASGNSSAVMAKPSGRRRRSRERLVWAAVVASLLGFVLWHTLHHQDAPRPTRSSLLPPQDAGFDFTGDFSGPPVLADDGSAVAFCAHTQRERNSIWVRSLSDLTSKKLDGTEGASFPFWSPDGKFLAFFADGHLKKVPSPGGPVTVLADAPNARGGSWSPDNIIVFEPDYRDVLWRISAAGGTAERLTKFDGSRHTTHRWPRFLPDGKHFLFFAANHLGGSQQSIYFGSLGDGSSKHVIDADSDAQYASGYLLYHLQTALLAQKFDPATGTVSGDPIPVANFVEYDAGTWHTTFTASQNGLLIYETGSKTLGTDLSWLDRSGKPHGKVGERAPYKGSGRFSPDGKKFVVSMGDPQADIWVFDLARGARTRLTFGGATHLQPSWSADGQKVVYVHQEGTTQITGTSLRAQLASGGGQEETLMANGSGTLLAPQWSPDGRYLLHIEQTGPTGAGVWALPTSGEQKPFQVVRPQTAQSRIIQFRLSPDGRWLAYSSTESGREEVYVTHFPDGAGRWQVSHNGGTFPAWRGDSKEIFFVGIDGSLYAAAMNTNSREFQMDQERSLFQIGYTSPLGNAYDVAPDGKRFVFATMPEGASTPLVMVTNWTAELAQK